jgi:tetratricopeptide (TPR) repeat protein
MRHTSAAKLALFSLVFSLNMPRISAFDPAIAPARARLQSPTIDGSQSESDSESRVESLIEQAQLDQNRGDFQRAAATYQEVVKLRPHFAEARANLGLMYHLLGDYTQAAGQFELALREQPQLIVPNLFLGLDLLELHEPRKALGYLQRAQRINPHDEPTALGLGRAYSALREFQPANDWYFRAAEMNPKDSEALYGLGITYLDLQKTAASELGSKGQDSLFGKRLLAEFFEQEGRLNDAVVLYKKLLETNTTWPGLRTALGFDYVQQGKVAAANAEFQAELGQNPGFLLARLGLARTGLEQADFKQCTQELAEIWRTDRTFFRANASAFLLGLSSEKAHAMEERLSQQAVGTLDPDLRSYLTGRLEELPQLQVSGLAAFSGQNDHTALEEKMSPSDLYRQGRYSSCAQDLKGTGHLDRNILLLLAQCSYYSGDYRVSFLAAGQVLTTRPSDFEALYWRAASTSKLAVQTLYAAGLADTNSYRVHLLLGEAYRMMKKHEASESEYRKALELKPKDPTVHLGLATLYWQTKDYDKALPELQQALAGRPNDPEASYLMGEIMVARHQYSDAQPYLTVALNATGSTVYYAHALRGKILAAQDRTDEAIKEFQLALPGDDDGSFHFQIYRLYTKVGNQKAAAAALRDSEAIRQRQAQGMRAAFERSE